jgi:hypothetical protein
MRLPNLNKKLIMEQCACNPSFTEGIGRRIAFQGSPQASKQNPIKKDLKQKNT